MDRRTTRRGEDDRDSGRGRDRGGRDDDRGSRGRDRDDDRGGRPSGRSSSYQYEGRSRDEMKKRSTQGANEYDKFLSDKIKMFKPNDGDNTIRILPPTWPKPKHYGLDIYVHYGVGPDRQAYLCLHKMKGEACPICEERQQALNDGDEKYAKEIEAKRRVLVYLVDRDHEKEGLQAWAMPWTVDRDLCTVSVDKKSGEVLPIDHPEEGYDVMFEKKGQKDRTEYIGMQIARRDSDLGNGAWLDAAMDLPLPDALIYYEYDHIAKVFGGGGAHKERRDERDDDRGGRDRSGRDRDDGRGDRGRDRDGGRDDDRRDSRASGRDDDARPRGRSREPDPPAFTWEQIHEMTSSELDALVEESSELADIEVKDYDSDEELADAICKVLGIEKQSARRRTEPEAESEGRGRLASMRERRTRGD